MKKAIDFAWLCRVSGIPTPVPELRFAPPRRWRFDWAWPDYAVALEIEGGTWTSRSRHTRGAGYLRDIEKYNEAAIQGWMLLRVTPAQVKDGTAVALVARALKVSR